MRVCFRIDFCYLFIVCVDRGELDLQTKKLHSSALATETLLGALEKELNVTLVKAVFTLDGEQFISSFPVDKIRNSRQFVENVHVRVDNMNKTIGISYSFGKALGSPLFQLALVEVSKPITATGPVFPESVPQDASLENASSEEPVEEPSMLRKYWWVFIGVMLLSSVFGSQPAAQAAAAT